MKTDPKIVNMGAIMETCIFPPSVHVKKSGGVEEIFEVGPIIVNIDAGLDVCIFPGSFHVNKTCVGVEDTFEAESWSYNGEHGHLHERAPFFRKLPC